MKMNSALKQNLEKKNELNRKWNELNGAESSTLDVTSLSLPWEKKVMKFFPFSFLLSFSSSLQFHSFILTLHIHTQFSSQRELKFIMFDHLSEPMNRRNGITRRLAFFNETRQRVEKFSWENITHMSLKNPVKKKVKRKKASPTARLYMLFAQHLILRTMYEDSHNMFRKLTQVNVAALSRWHLTMIWHRLYRRWNEYLECMYLISRFLIANLTHIVTAVRYLNVWYLHVEAIDHFKAWISYDH